MLNNFAYNETNTVLDPVTGRVTYEQSGGWDKGGERGRGEIMIKEETNARARGARGGRGLHERGEGKEGEEWGSVKGEKGKEVGKGDA